MKRSKPIRRTPLKRGQPPKRKTMLKSKRGDSAKLRKARNLSYERAEGLCEARWEGCTRRGEAAHHVRRRSQGGADTPDNLLIVCTHCHGQIHANPELAHSKGHLRFGEDA